MLVSALLPLPSADSSVKLRNSLLTPDDIKAFQTLSEFNTSKKEKQIREHELFKIVEKPLEMFFEEKLTHYLSQINESPVLRALLQAITFCKFLVASIVVLTLL